MIGRREEPLKQTKEEMEKQFPHTTVFWASCKPLPLIHLFQGDIRDPTALEELVEKVLKEFGKIDILINNAGGQFPINAENLTAKGFEGSFVLSAPYLAAVIRNNLLGTWNMTRAVATKAFIPQQSGSVVNVIAQVRKYGIFCGI